MGQAQWIMPAITEVTGLWPRAGNGDGAGPGRRHQEGLKLQALELPSLLLLSMTGECSPGWQVMAQG